MRDPAFILDIEWDRPKSTDPVLPPLVGPFKTREEAQEWAHLNIPNGSWEARPVAWPWSSGGWRYTS
jgi:hypothetical protein